MAQREDGTIDIRKRWPEGSAAEAAEAYRAQRLAYASMAMGHPMSEVEERAAHLMLIELADTLATRTLNEGTGIQVPPGGVAQPLHHQAEGATRHGPY